MDKRSAAKKKFNIRGVLDGISSFRSSVSSSQKSDSPGGDIEETLRSEHFQVTKTVRHGFPFQPTAMAYDPVQNLLAIGTRSGALRIFGRPGVDCHVRHDGDVAVLQILFLVNEGALITVTSDDQVHLWTLRQKKPELIHSLKFTKERSRITYCHLPFQSKWLYIGTVQGNVHIVNIESFVLSGYIINWNKAIELSQKTHPGPVVHLSDNPLDPNKMLIGFESGAIVLWDLKCKTADVRFMASETVRAICWHHEGKQFLCSHSDGSLTTWNIKTPAKPSSVVSPHAKVGKDGKAEPCRPITKVDWKSVRNGEPYVIFSGGMPYDPACKTPSLTVMHAKNTTVLEMEHTVVDFLTLCPTPWNNDFQEPYGIVVLLQNDLVVVDLTSPGYPCFENPYPMDIHESPVTCCRYYADCPPDLIPAFYSVGSKQKRSGFSEKEWPIKGGEWGTTTCSYPEIIITGHVDGSVKFWDASAVTLQVLYKLKTAKVFERHKLRGADADEEPFAIQHLSMCTESRQLCVAGLTHIILFKFAKQEAMVECLVLEVSLVYEIYDELDSPVELEYPSTPHLKAQTSGSVGSYSSTASDGKESVTSVRVKTGQRKWSSGYQPDLCAVLTWIDNEPPPPITSINLNTRYALLAFGNECGLAIVDLVQKSCILNMGTPDLYGSLDPYSRVPRSPKSRNQPPRPAGMDNLAQALNTEECKSPTNSDQSQQGGRPCSPGTNTSPDRMALHTSGSRTSYALQRITEHGERSGEQHHVPASPIEVAVDAAAELADAQTGPATTHGDPMHELQIKKKPLAMSRSLPICSQEKANNLYPAVSTGDMLDAASTEDPTQPVAQPPTPGVDIQRDGEERRSKKYRFGFHRHKDIEATSCSQQTLALLDPDKQDHSIENRTASKSESDLCHMVDENSSAKNHPVLDRPTLARRGFVRRMSQKIRSSVIPVLKHEDTSGKDLTDNHVVSLSTAQHKKVMKLESIKFDVIDLTPDEVPFHPAQRKLTYLTHLTSDKGDGSFSRSRSSSMSSLDNVSKEAISSMVFADVYTRKSDSSTAPCLWVGTNLGSVLVITVQLPSEDQRKTQPVVVSPSGSIFRLKGAILAMSFLDCNGVLIPSLTDAWRDPSKEEGSRQKYNRQQSMSSMKAKMSPTSSTDQPNYSDRQYAILCSEKQARVIALPSQTCAYKVKITETSIVTQADIMTLKDSVCLCCYVANGHIMTFSLPSLKPLLDVDYLPLTEERSERSLLWIAKTFSFSSNGHALYFCSPTEVQKLTISAEITDNLSDMLGDLFLPCETPEGPKQNFFKNLFTGGASTLDREELFGESSGKASKGVAQYTPGTASVQAKAGSAMGAVLQARQALDVRGQRLGELSERTELMRESAEEYSKTAHLLMQKYKDKKWYQF